MKRNIQLVNIEKLSNSIKPKVIFVGFYKASPDWVSKPQQSIRNYFSFWYVTKGRGFVKLNNKWLNFSTGDLVTIKAGDNYEQEKADPKAPFELYYINVFPFVEEENNMQISFCDIWPAKMYLKYNYEIPQLFAELFETFTTRSPSANLLINAIMLHILYILINAYNENAGANIPPAYSKLLTAREFICQHYKEKLNLEEIASYSDLSESYLSALFYRYFKISPINYQIMLKLRSAKLLLAKGVPVSEVADQVGFRSLEHFSRMFKKHIGTPPIHFAALHRRK